MNGFVTIDRSVFGHGFFPKEKMSEREAWIWIIQNAAWKDTQHRVGGKILPVPRGSFMTTLRELQAVFCWKSDTKVRNFLKRLEAERMIERTACGPKNAPKTHVTICNYEEYQTSGRTKNAPETHRTRHEKRSKGTSINNKQDTPNGVLAKPASKGNRLPDDWALPRQWGQWAVGEGWEPDQIRSEADKFRDYWVSVSGQKGVKRDWLATWRNWMRNSNTPKGKLNATANDRNRPSPASASHENLFAGFAIAGQRGAPPNGGETDEASGQGMDFGQSGDTSGELLRFPASGEYSGGDC